MIFTYKNHQGLTAMSSAETAHTLRVFKFGGTSVGSAENMRLVAQIVHAESNASALVVVASAMSGVTDLLVTATQQASRGDVESIDRTLKILRSMHHQAIDAFGGETDGPDTKSQIDELLGKLLRILRATAYLRELTPRARDAVLSMGEKLSIRILALALEAKQLKVVCVDADTFLDTDDRFGSANPLSGVGERTIKNHLRVVFEQGAIPIVTGFCGRAPDGSTTTLGRGGSDLTATTLGAALGAESVTLWSDVDGVFTAHPKLVPDARPLAHLNFREAAEMSFYGAKVIHQRSMMPVADKHIPVYARNTFNPDAAGTLIDGSFTLGSHPVKAVTAVADQALVTIEGKGMAGVYGIAARVFDALASAEINVTMISQSSSEASITFALQREDANRAHQTLKVALSSELSQGLVDDVVVNDQVSLVAAVGLGMAHQPGISGRVFSAVARADVNVLAIAQGASELNISFAVSTADTKNTVTSLHEEFALAQQDSGVDVGRHFDLIFLGCGQIGRRVLELLAPRIPHIEERYELTTRVVAVADRSGYLLNPTGISTEALSALSKAKADGQSIASFANGIEGSPLAMLENALKFRLARPVFVDVSNHDEADLFFKKAFELGTDIVTANKAPLSGPLEVYERVVGPANVDRLLRAESTVGAGLPVLDTIQLLRATGDKVRRIEGCLSGTLGFVATRLEEGSTLSAAVKEAMDNGFTEPDPALDLSGTDVGRKALILARISGIARDADFPDIEGFVPANWIGLETHQLMSKIEELDEVFAFRVQQASDAGECLRFVATVSPGHIEVGLKSVLKTSPLGGLHGTDNMVVFYSDRYADQPLVVSGPGAGADVTAMGVLGDIIRIAMERA